MHPVAQHREDNDFLKQNAKFLFKYRELIQGHAWFPYVPVPLQIPGIKQVPLGALLELAGDSSKEFCRLCEDAAWRGPIIMDLIPDKLVIVTDPEIDIESPSSLFRYSKSPMEERADAEQTVIRDRIRALSELCVQYDHADAVPPKSDLREVVASLKRTGRLAYLTDEQLEQLRCRLHAFNVYDSLEEMENCLVDDFLEDIIFSCRRGACATFRPENFQYYWSRVQYPYHFTAHYAKDRNVCVFSEWTGIINSLWSMRRAQEEYLQALYVSRFEAIHRAVEEAVKNETDIWVEDFDSKNHSFSLVNRTCRNLPALTLWEVLEAHMEEDASWVTLKLDDGGENIIEEDFEQIRNEHEKAQRQRAKELIPEHADLLQRIIDGAASDEDLEQCVKLCDQIEWGQQEVEDE